MRSREHKRERSDAERDARRQAEPPREPVDGNRRQGHGEGSDRLRQVIRDADITHEPGRRGEQRLEERREVRRMASDEWAAGLGDRTSQRRVEVFVAEVDGRRAHPGESDAHGKAEPDDAGEEPSGGHAAARHHYRGHRQTRFRGSGRDFHKRSIGRRGAGLYPGGFGEIWLSRRAALKTALPAKPPGPLKRHRKRRLSAPRPGPQSPR